MAVHTAPYSRPPLTFGQLNNHVMFRVPGYPDRLYIKTQGLNNARLLHPQASSRGKNFDGDTAVEIVDIVDVTVEVKRA